jgi:hypothetical protein
MIIIDDPLKPDDAMSEVKRSGANQWLLSRLDHKRTGAIIVVMQRVHIDDLRSPPIACQTFEPVSAETQPVSGLSRS